MGNLRLRRALADLGFALTVIRRGAGGELLAEDVEPGKLTPLAVVWDDDPAVLRRRIIRGIAKLDEHEAGRLLASSLVELAKAG